MNGIEARALFLEHCQTGERGTLERYGEKAAVAAILAVTAHIEAEARRYASNYRDNTDGWNTHHIFADAVADLTAERVGHTAEPRINTSDITVLLDEIIGDGRGEGRNPQLMINATVKIVALRGAGNA